MKHFGMTLLFHYLTPVGKNSIYYCCVKNCVAIISFFDSYIEIAFKARLEAITKIHQMKALQY